MMYLFIKSYEEFWDLGFIRNNKRQLSATIDSLNEIQVFKTLLLIFRTACIKSKDIMRIFIESNNQKRNLAV